jgi:transcriptional regulator with XRE-family HTH domain
MSQRTAARLPAEIVDRRRRIGAAIRRARGSTTQVELAARLGIGQPALSGWEQGLVALDLEKLRTIERELGLESGALATAGGFVRAASS